LSGKYFTDVIDETKGLSSIWFESFERFFTTSSQ